MDKIRKTDKKSGEHMSKTYSSAHANEREDAEESIPESKGQSQIEWLPVLHVILSSENKSNITRNKAERQRPVVGGEVDSAIGIERQLQRSGKELRGGSQQSGKLFSHFFGVSTKTQQIADLKPTKM